MVVPGSGLVKAQPRRKASDEIFIAAGSNGASRLFHVPGHERRQIGAEERCASTPTATSKAARAARPTHLMARRWRRPRSAGHLADVREYQ